MDEALKILEEIEGHLNECCAITMYSDEVLKLTERLKDILNAQK